MRGTNLKVGTSGVQHLSLHLLLLLSWCCETETVIQQNFPGTKWQDLTQPSVVSNDDGEIYQTFAGGMGRDLTAPNYYRDEETLYREALPGIKTKDYSEPSFSILNDDDL